MALCDLCQEYTTTDEHCSECGHQLRHVERPTIEVPTAFPPRGLEPFGAAMPHCGRVTATCFAG